MAAFAGLLTGKVRIRWFQFALLVEEAGVRALPIMTLIGILIGIILAFGGALQLQQLGVQIFVADVVGVAVAQEVGALMTAILLAGRTGAAFAAQLGSMQVKEEIDALTTAGISPVQFLVLPRVLALVLMTPVLTIYADLFAMLGGGLVAITILDLSVTAYVVRLVQVVSISDFGMGLVRASVFGGADRHGRLPPRHAEWAERLGGGAGGHLRRGHIDRPHHHRGRTPERHLPRAPPLSRHDLSLPVPPMPDAPPRIEVVDLDMAYGGFVVQRNLHFTVRPAEIFVVMGGSGSGQEHPLATPDRPQGAGARRRLLRRAKPLDRRSSGTGSDDAAGRRGVSEQRALELLDLVGERGAVAGGVHGSRGAGDP